MRYERLLFWLVQHWLCGEQHPWELCGGWRGEMSDQRGHKLLWYVCTLQLVCSSQLQNGTGWLQSSEYRHLVLDDRINDLDQRNE